MANIELKDLNTEKTLSNEELSAVNGGWWWLYQPVTSYYYNPFVYTMQSSWASRAMSMDAQHNSFIDFIRS